MRRFAAIAFLTLGLALPGCASQRSRDLEAGWELMQAQNYAAARDKYIEILAENPNEPFALLNLGVAYHNLGEYDLARQNYEAAIEHGKNAEVTRVVEEGSVKTTATTVADKGRDNLALLPKR